MRKLFRWLFGPKVAEATPQDVLDAVKGLVRRIEDQEERCERLEGQVRRMRGYVYAKKGDLLDTFVDEAATPNSRKAFLERESRRRRLTKSELRELAGLAPARHPPPAESHHE